MWFSLPWKYSFSLSLPLPLPLSLLGCWKFLKKFPNLNYLTPSPAVKQMLFPFLIGHKFSIYRPHTVGIHRSPWHTTYSSVQHVFRTTGIWVFRARMRPTLVIFSSFARSSISSSRPWWKEKERAKTLKWGVDRGGVIFSWSLFELCSRGMLE